MTFLMGLLASIIRPIIQEEIANLKAYISEQYQLNKKFEGYDKEVVELIEAAENATTTEEVWAHVRRLKEHRARLNL